MEQVKLSEKYTAQFKIDAIKDTNEKTKESKKPVLDLNTYALIEAMEKLARRLDG